jgi:Lambda phage tail tube protein, TTP
MAKYTSKGTIIQKSIASVFTTIAQVKSIDAPKAKVEVVDISDLSTGAGKVKGVTGYADGGEAGGSCFFDPADTTHKNLTESLSTIPTAADSWKVIYSDVAPTTWPFSGWLTNFDVKAAVGQFLMADFSITLTGLPTYP